MSTRTRRERAISYQNQDGEARMSRHIHIGRRPRYLQEMTEEDILTFRRGSGYAAASGERLFALIQATKYIVANKIPGDIVVCGVAKGGSTIIIARTLYVWGKPDRHIHLYDTFENVKRDEHDLYITPRRKVKTILAKRIPGYPRKLIHTYAGMVEDTLPERAPKQIALMHLDTDFYESTKHELIHLYPRLVPGGVIMIDDYGCWEGAQQATDEYIAENNVQLFLSAVDYTGRIGVKQ